MKENIIEALLEIKSHKMRSFLTMLGVIIGIASIIAIVSTIKGTNDQIMQNLVGKGNNNVSIMLTQGDAEYEMDDYSELPAGIGAISDDQKKRIREIDNAIDASFYYLRSYSENVTFREKTLSGSRVYGIDDHFLNTCGYEIYRGRDFVPADRSDHHKVALLDSAAADILFIDRNAVGQTIEIGGEPFVVVGLFQAKDAFSPEIRNLSDYEMYRTDSYGTVLIPDAAWPIVYRFDEPENAYVRADSTSHMSDIGKKAEEIMRESINTKKSSLLTYTAQDLMEEAKSEQQLANSTNRLLVWVASIALLVGGIGVMNIMLVSVTERTREIGLKRSLGARKKTILLQFLTESAVLTSLGGVFGIIVGIALAMIISRITGIPVGISIGAIAVSVIFSMAIGLIFGLLPSIKAANLSPIEAMRRQ